MPNTARLDPPQDLNRSATYETDFYTWTQQQAALLRAGRLAELDVSNLAEELEDMGRSEKRELTHRLAVLLAHLLKWGYQPKRRGKSWRLTVKEQRIQVQRELRQNPGLKALLKDVLADAYEDAQLQAAKETDLDESVFPQTCLWTFEQIIDAGFLPESLDE